MQQASAQSLFTVDFVSDMMLIEVDEACAVESRRISRNMHSASFMYYQ